MPTYVHVPGVPLASESNYEIEAIHDPEAWNLHEELYKEIDAGRIKCEDLPRYFSNENQVFYNALNKAYSNQRISYELFEIAVKLENDITIYIFYKKDPEMAHYCMILLLTLMHLTGDPSLIAAANKYYIYYDLAIDKWPDCPISKEYKYKRGEEEMEIW